MSRLGVGSCLGKRRRRPPSPNGIAIGGSRACKLWSETAVGTTTPSVASGVAAYHSWEYPSKVTVTGTGPWTMLETAETGRHYNYTEAITNEVRSWADGWIDVVPLGATRWFRLDVGGNRKANFDLVAGAVGLVQAGCTATVTALPGGGFRIYVYGQMVPGYDGSMLTEFLQSNLALGSNPSYAGNVANGVTVLGSSVTWRQIRAAAQNNLARANDNSLVDAVGGVQTTIVNQPLILDQNGNFYAGASGQIPVVTREAGRVSFLAYADADVVGVVNGNDPAFAVAGICKLSGAGAAPLVWYGSGSAADIPFRINGTNLESHRHDGTTGSTKTLGTNLAASVGSWTSFAFLRHADRSCQLYLAGALVATVTHDDLASLTATSFQTGPVTVTTPVQYSLARMAWAGDLTYDAIRPALLAACARYPGLGLVA